MMKRMKMMNPLKLGVLAAGLLVPGAAYAAVDAIVTTDLNMRTGPSTGYQVVDVIPDGGHVTVYGCVSDYDWCDVSWRGLRGWASGNYLAYLGERYYRDPIPTIGVTIGVPIIGYDYDNYFDRWYRHQRREIRRDIRQDRREDRREVRQERREDRRAVRHERRDVKQERRDVRNARQDLREARRNDENVKQERREVRKQQRQLRQERRDLRDARRDRRD